ncbi:MAG: hypothetical protein WCG85_20050 [Polyangia bacterium]
MNLKLALDKFMERTAAGVRLGAGDKDVGSGDAGRADARRQMVRDLDRVSRASTWWCLVMVVLAAALAGLALALNGAKEVATLLGAGGLGLALLRTWRRKFAADVLIALLKASGDDSEEWRKTITVFRDRI